MTGWGRSADKLISNSQRVNYTMYKSGDVDDIIKVILFADKVGRFYTEKFAAKLKRSDDYQTLENIWDFVKEHIKYIVDIPGHEKIKSPGATWKDKFGDCKSHSVLVGSLLHNLGFDFVYRVAFYDAAHPELGHIYCVAVLDGKEVIVDTVNTAFDKQEPYWKAFDYSPHSGKKVQISGIKSGNWLWAGGLAGILFLIFKKMSND